jgi:hypothetical protein
MEVRQHAMTQSSYAYATQSGGLRPMVEHLYYILSLGAIAAAIFSALGFW